MTEPAQRAAAYFETGLNCAQSVLAAFAEQLDMNAKTLLKLASPFGGGIARRGHICGAVSGALMALGLARGACAPEDKPAAYQMADEFLTRFETRHGFLLCRDLTGCDLTIPEGQEQAARRDIHHTICAALVLSAAEIAADIMDAKSASAA